MFHLEKSIKNWLKNFHKQRAFEDGAIREMELHLRDHIEDLISEGYQEKEAFEIAVAEFGDISSLAKEEFTNIKVKTTLRSIIYTHMLNNYFKTSLRTMKKSPLTSFINVFGLAVAIGICMVVYSFMDNDLSIDRHHKNKDEVYLATFRVEREGKTERYGKSPAPMAEMLKADFSNIKNFSRVHDISAIIKHKDKVFNENIRFTDPAFLEMMTFPLKWGNKKALNDVNSIILSEEMSIKYFGYDNPVGKNILVKFGENNSKTFNVSGVAETFPDARIIEFGFLMNFDNLKVARPELALNNWKTLLNGLLIHVEEPSDLTFINQKMDKYIALQNTVEKDWPISSFDFVSIHDLHLESRHIIDDISYDASLEGRVTLPVIALFMILLACFNYINIGVVSASGRLKEIGLRKVIGANRKKIITQFLSENLLITFIAGLIGLFLAVTVFLPWFINISEMPLKLQLMDVDLWLFLGSVLVITAIISGIYPALYISKFSVVNIFKGSVKFGKKNPVTKVFLGVQLVLACIGITGAVMYTQNTAYQAERSWGYDQKNTIYAEFSNQEAHILLKEMMVKNADVLSIAGTTHHLGKSMRKTVLHSPDHQYEVFEMAVGPDYIHTMGIELQDGRTFEKNQQSDYSKILVNEQFIENTGLENPIGAVYRIDSIRHEIIGVVKDFHFNNFYYENRPTIITLAEESYFQFVALKVRPGSNQEVYDNLQSSWASLFPETPFQGGYQDEIWVGFQQDLINMRKFMTAIAIVLTILASLGLYGLVKLNIAGRIREFSIRKVLGATLKNLASDIYKQYIRLSLIAVIIGAPVSYFLIKANLDMMFPDQRPHGYSGVIISVSILVLVLISVIASQIRKVLKSNPVKGLKTE